MPRASLTFTLTSHVAPVRTRSSDCRLPRSWDHSAGVSATSMGSGANSVIVGNDHGCRGPGPVSSGQTAQRCGPCCLSSPSGTYQARTTGSASRKGNEFQTPTITRPRRLGACVLTASALWPACPMTSSVGCFCPVIAWFAVVDPSAGTGAHGGRVPRLRDLYGAGGVNQDCAGRSCPFFRNASEEFDEPERCAVAEAEVSDLVRTRGFRSNASAPGRGPAAPPVSSRQPAGPVPSPISQHATRSRRRNARSRCWPRPA